MNTINGFVSRATWLGAMTFVVALSGCSQKSSESMQTEVTPPDVEQRPYTVESPQGNRVDPYYWLRDDSREDPEIIAYLEAENEYYDSYRAHYSELTERVTEEVIGRIKQDDESVPYPLGDYSYSTRYEEGQEYPIYMRKHLETGQEQTLLNVNELAQGFEYFSVSNWEVSPDQQWLAYMVDTSGRRQYELRVRHIASGEEHNDGLTGLSAAIAWAKDNKTLFVIENDPQTLLSTRVLKHEVGTPADSAELLYEETDNTFYMWVYNTTDHDYVVIDLESTVSSEVHVLDADTPDGELQVIAPRERDVLYTVDHLEGDFIITTDWDAPNFRIMKVDADEIGSRDNWEIVVPHREDVMIQSIEVFSDYLAINERSEGLRRIRVAPWEDLEQSVFIETDEEAYVMSFSTNYQQNTKELRFNYSSLTTPTITYALDMETGEQVELKQTEVVGDFDSDNYVTERVWATADDGTQIPVTLLHHKNFEQDGTAPLYQYAYGSYGSSSDPYFRSSVLSLVDRGFVYAIAHIRGGQEMGRQWYEDGKMLNKINTFTDFIDVTEFLVAERYADPQKVVAMGGSAGGLLMGAVANMAPELYTGIVAHVPFVDVVTTMLDESIPLTTNEFDEWGNPKHQPYYDYMLSYSPYDQVSAQDYPAFLVTTGLHDSQVQYFEPAKWVARLRDLKTDDNPLVFSINMDAGHGGSSGRFSRLEEVAQEYAFVIDLVGASQTPIFE
ncbi:MULTISPECIES: S9 family peptidase [Gammaproteobacteria]|uniref:S9 family peptidase n=1 Tax=Gammaproteobacteria TaxID=1236 RepID=UPI001FB378DB|nr:MULTISPECIES: S9 family peptidase [Gammaproteobacteria]